MRRSILLALALGAMALASAPSFSATLDGDPFNEAFSTNFVPQAGIPFPCAPCLVGPSAELSGGNAWVIGVIPLYDDDPTPAAPDPNAWTTTTGLPLSIHFTTPMAVVEFYAASLAAAGATIDVFDPINGDTLGVPVAVVFSPPDGFGAGGTYSFGGNITDIVLTPAGAAPLALDSLGYTMIPIPAALPLLLAGIAGIGFTARRKRR